MDSTIVVLLWIAIGGLVGAAIGQKKGRAGGGFVLGAVLGFLGWILVAVGPNMGPKCPECGGDVVEGARKCKNCGSDLPASPSQVDCRHCGTSAVAGVACPSCGQAPL